MLEKDYPIRNNRNHSMSELRALIEDKKITGFLFDGKHIGEIVFFDDADGEALRISDLGGTNIFIEKRNEYVTLEWYVADFGAFITLNVKYWEPLENGVSKECVRTETISARPMIFTAFKD